MILSISKNKMTDESGNKLSIKLLIDKKKKVVVFAEAGKDFVDFIFHILALPMATVTRLLTKTAMVGSLGNLYGSFQTLDSSYLELSKKSTLLKPKTPSYRGGSYEALLLPHATTTNPANSIFTTTYYRCGSDCRDYVSETAYAKCPRCNKPMKKKLKLVEGGGANLEANSSSSSSSGGGYVKGEVAYMVMDNLVVQPIMSSISSNIAILNKLNVKDLSVVEEKTVEFGFEQGVHLLETSLKSTTVLTDVFLSEMSSSLRSVDRKRMEEVEKAEEVEEEVAQVVEEIAHKKKKKKKKKNMGKAWKNKKKLI